MVCLCLPRNIIRWPVLHHDRGLVPNYNLYFVKRTMVESVEYQLRGWVNWGYSGIFVLYERCKAFEVILFKFLGKNCLPAVFYFNTHNQIRGIFIFLHSLRISSGHILDCISPICAFLSSSIHRRDCPIPPPMLNGRVSSSKRLWK